MKNSLARFSRRWMLAFSVVAFVGGAGTSYAAPISATALRYSEVTPEILRKRRLSQPRAMRMAMPRAIDRAATGDLNAIGGSTEVVRMIVDSPDVRLRLVLAEFEPSFDNVEVIDALPDGSLQSSPVQRSGTKFYLGHVSRSKDTFAWLYETEVGWGGEVRTDSGTYILEPTDWSDSDRAAGTRTTSFLYREDETAEHFQHRACGERTGEGDMLPAAMLPAATQPQDRRATFAIQRYDVHYVAARDYWLARGGGPAGDAIVANELITAHYTTSNAMQLQIGSGGIALAHTLTRIYHVDLPPDPWFTNPAETDGNVLLDSVVRCRSSLACGQGSFFDSTNTLIVVLAVARQALHDATGAIVGLANRGSLCSSNAAAIVETTGTTTNGRFARLSHELGHVLGACHDGPNPGSGCPVCPDTSQIMSPTSGDNTIPQYSSCSVSAMNAKVNASPYPSCRTVVSCGDVTVDRKHDFEGCGPDEHQDVFATDALLALKMAVGQFGPLSYSVLADVSAPIGSMTAADALRLLNYSVCRSPNGLPPYGSPATCGY